MTPINRFQTATSPSWSLELIIKFHQLSFSRLIFKDVLKQPSNQPKTAVSLLEMGYEMGYLNHNFSCWVLSIEYARLSSRAVSFILSFIHTEQHVWKADCWSVAMINEWCYLPNPQFRIYSTTLTDATGSIRSIQTNIDLNNHSKSHNRVKEFPSISSEV